MSRSVKLVGCIAAVFVLLLAVPSAWAHPEFARQTKAACGVCHVNPAGGADLTDAGKAFKADGKAPAAGALKAPEYVGVKKCGMCHPKQYKAWQQSKHAGALAGLEKADAKMVAEVAAKVKVEVKGSAAKTDGCVRCHVTGYQLAGGYPGADAVKGALVANVTCEACHGPGGKHVVAAAADKKKMINAAPTAGSCLGCHTPALSPNFKFEELKKLVHPVAAG